MFAAASLHIDALTSSPTLANWPADFVKKLEGPRSRNSERREMDPTRRLASACPGCAWVASRAMFCCDLQACTFYSKYPHFHRPFGSSTLTGAGWK